MYRCECFALTGNDIRTMSASKDCNSSTKIHRDTQIAYDLCGGTEYARVLFLGFFYLFYFLLLKESKLFSDESTKAQIVPRTLARTRNPDRERSELMAGQE